MESVVTISRLSFRDTVDALVAAVSVAGAKLFTLIDQSAEAAQVGLTLRPTILLVFGNPKGGTPLMDAVPLTALDLPLKLAIWEEDGIVSVAYTPPAVIAARYGVTGMDALIAGLTLTLEHVVASVATPLSSA